MLWLALRRRDRWELEVEEEIKLHLALRAEQLMIMGHSADDAYAEAVRRFGPLSHSRARLVDAARLREQRMQRTEYLSDLQQDVTFALRGLARQKVWTFVTIATLALGIGATTAVFSVVSTLLLHPLPYPNADRVVYVNQQPSNGNNTGITVMILPASPVVRAWKKFSHSFEAIEPYMLSRKRLKTTSDEPSRVVAEAVMPSLFQFTAAHPVLGRNFTSADVQNGGRVAMLGEGFWRDRLGADTRVIGRALTLDDTLFTIVGVMPGNQSTDATRATDVWLPLDINNNSLGLRVIGRLRPGAKIPQANKELDSIFARQGGFSGSSIPFRTAITTPAQRVSFRDSLVMLTVAVGLVLLVACANVAHLLVARSASRHREFAVRAALGADRERLLRQMLTECLLLSSVAGVTGLILGWVMLRVLVSLRPDSLYDLLRAHLDATTLGVAITVAVVSGAAFAMLSAIHASSLATHEALKSGTLGTASRLRPRGGGRALLVISEMALSATLLVGATLFVRTTMSLQHQDLGFQPNGLYSLHVSFDSPGFEAPAVRHELIDDAASRLQKIPGVTAVAVTRVSPGGRSFAIGRLEIQGEAPPPRTSSSFIEWNSVRSNYFATLGMRLLEGTLFTDTSAAARQVIVNDGFARKHWTSGRAIGQHIRIAQSDSEPWRTIVGVVNDVATNGPLAESSAPILYSPLTTIPESVDLLVRTTSTAASLTPIIAFLKRAGLKRAQPPLSVASEVALSIATPRYITLLLTIFTALALVLTSIGLYGVMSYTVAQETRDIGIRVALGASGRRIARSVIARGTALAIVGAIVGLIAASWGTKLIESQLHGVTRLDPISFAIGAAVLVSAALLACIVPVRRAISVDPMTAIRAE